MKSLKVQHDAAGNVQIQRSGHGSRLEFLRAVPYIVLGLFMLGMIPSMWGAYQRAGGIGWSEAPMFLIFLVMGLGFFWSAWHTMWQASFDGEIVHTFDIHQAAYRCTGRYRSVPFDTVEKVIVETVRRGGRRNSHTAYVVLLYTTKGQRILIDELRYQFDLLCIADLIATTIGCEAHLA